MSKLTVMWTMLAVSLLVGCGIGSGGGSGEPSPLARLEGDWLGSTFVESQFEVTFDGGGKILRYMERGATTAGGGTSTHILGPVFGVDVAMLDGSTKTWRLVLSDGDTHAALIRSDGGDIAVLERGATTHTLFQNEDFGSKELAGTAVAFDPAGDLAAFEDSAIEIDSSLLYKGNFGSLTFSARGQRFDLVWPMDTDGEGGYEDSAMLRGDKLMMIMSPDATFIAGVVFDFGRGSAPYATVRYLAAWRELGR